MSNGYLSDAQIADKFAVGVPLKQVPKLKQDILSSLAAGQITPPAPRPPKGGSPSSRLGKVGQGAGLVSGVGGSAIVASGGTVALTGAGIAAAGIATAGIAAAGIALLIGIKSLFGGHHAAAVQNEQAILSESVPLANQILMQIDQNFSQNKITASDARSALDTLQQGFESDIGPIIREGVGACNAACIFHRILSAVVYKKKQDYAENPVGDIAAKLGLGNIAANVGTTGSALLIGVIVLIFGAKLLAGFK